MALAVSVVQSCGTCFGEKCLRSVITFEAEKGYMNVLCNKMRFKNFLFSRVSKLCSQSKHKIAERLLEEVERYEAASVTDRSKLLNKVSVLMGYNSLHDLIQSERAQKDSGMNVKDTMVDFDVSLACKRFPSIILGCSPAVELYDETSCWFGENSLLTSEICKGFLSSSVGAKWLIPDNLREAWPPLYPGLPNANSNLFSEESSYASPLSSESLNLESETNSVLYVTTEESSTRDGFESKQNAASVELILDKSISCIPGFSKRQFRLLENCGFHTLRKLLHHFPRTYADLQNAQIGIDDGQYLIFIGRILTSKAIRTSYSFSFLEVVIECEVGGGESTSAHVIDETDRSKQTIHLHLKKFFRGTRFTFQPFLKSIQGKHKEGDIVCVSGKVRIMRTKGHYEMREYNLDVLEDEQDSSAHAEGRPYPIYPSKGGLKPNFLRDIISSALKSLPDNVDPIPQDVTRDFGLVSLHDAYLGIHQPKNLDEADLARKRLIFDEFFYLQLGRLFQMLEGLGTQIEKDVLLDKYRKPVLNSVFMEEWSSLTKNFLKALPYSLTSSQLTAVSEIIWDLKRPVPMNRLLQGDVGCGKTVVAFLACMEVIGAGYQAAFMVPTELLAVQHYEHFLNLLENMEHVDCKPSVALLTGSTPSKQSRLVREGLQSGDISLVIGTHSLIAEKVEFSALRIAVVDEQHRFGVIQRGRFNSKLYYTSISSRMAVTSSSNGSLKGDVYMAPHVLAMSATPIPRTLALALYGDMSLTQITDLPPGRLPVETCIIEGNDSGFEKVYQMMTDELEAGGKIYLVYPVIEQSEQLPQLRAASADLETISKRFEAYSCGLLHGKMRSDEKDDALRRFRSGEICVLLSTQVIEIGVDVPDASMMVVMNAERFGIAQLHQLRGRVGRGVRKSKCVLLASMASSINRLKVLEKSSDGFYLANMDLLLRGPGDLLGKKQSGHLPEFPIARLEIDGNILQEAHHAALRILGSSHDLEKFPELKAELSMRQPLCLLGD
ncbi:ATP-dependent DNA helicase homolog RECG, chloroplastic [Camellia sinensis]|uniref:ATP-dependent DNA helicase homolog RECG, chloroplastic n=3 Tax=Camellia sinensis TaxID=4442 RepID=UPI0010358BA3|nr:ATP-dependent DNA helicase homolog RECG, chloroplastic [Camellia sinensis]